MPCTICFETFTGTDVIELECGHVLHRHCLIKLIESRNRKCPLCRARIVFLVKNLKLS